MLGKLIKYDLRYCVRKFWLICAGLLALSVVLLDQLTKWLTVWKWPRPFGEGDEVWVIPGFFRLVHWRNLGAAWSILEGRMGLLTVISMAFTSIP